MAAPVDRPRYRALGTARPFHVVLVEPEIPPNTGNVARLCGATRSTLHLVGQLGFDIDEHAVRRAGLDYWHLVDVRTHADLETAESAIRTEDASSTSWLFSAHGGTSYADVAFLPGDALVFGRESVGLPSELLEERHEHALAIPTIGAVRSLNLANSVAIAVYEALRQNGALERCR